MLAHIQGQLLNSSKLGESLGVSHHTVRTYLEMLEQTFMLRILQPYAANLKKRLVKSPKIYIRDAGILHALLDIETQNDLLGHPVYGASWEGLVIENICSTYPEWRPYFFRSSSGAEIDLILTKGQRRVAIECKASSAPQVRRGFFNALKDLEIKEAWVLAPVSGSYPLKGEIFVSAPVEFLKKFS
jgi:predicted AAA+ superfamily ATPase